VNVLAVGVHAVDMQASVDYIRSVILQRKKTYVCVTGVHGVMEAQRDPHFLGILNSCPLVVPDGMPLVWAGHLQDHRSMGRVYGPDLMLEVCRALAPMHVRHFLYGGTPGVAEELKASLQEKVPGIQVVGVYTPPFRDLTAEEEQALASQVADCAPDVLWVGLSTPKQERFMAKFIDRLEVPVMLGVGAAFDLHTGRMKDAPEWMKRCGLQWLHRLIQDPKRLWKRYLRNNPEFVVRFAWQIFSQKAIGFRRRAFHSGGPTHGD
jgi:N-acetylglucosaminyldiphosphoundecaprenol N-acetyl-beta-D-mannosaminyltransferase